jgi:hypothetical protein
MNCRLLGVMVAVLALALVLSPVQAADDDKDFKPLFNGKDLTGFKTMPADAKDTFKVDKEMIVVSGKPNGYFYTDKSYKNYILRFDVQYAKPAGLTDDTQFKGNSGFLIHITGDHKVWPKCVEVQGMNSDMGNIFSIGGAAKGTFKKEAAVQKEAIKPVGEWNAVEIISDNGKLTSKINGKVVCEGSSELMEGPIGWQSEGAEIHFKNIRIKEMK